MASTSDLLALLKGRYSSLTIGFNEHHAPSCVDAHEWHERGSGYSGDDRDIIEWVSEDDRLKAIRENSVWTIQWYPDTPVGFYCVGASTFEAALKYALEPDE